ncbi:MAG: hypothetical protein AAB922_06410 [Patescibacteria group bacterium]
MAEAKQYVALEDFKFRGVQRKTGDVFRITDEKAAKLSDKVKLANGASPVVLSQPAPIAPTVPLSQPKMAQFTVKEAFETPAVEAVVAVEASEGVEAVVAVEAKEAIQHNVGDVIELSDEAAAELGEKVEVVV